jgi:hypothetical protein
MHAHTHLLHKYTYIPIHICIYMYNAYIYVHTYMYQYIYPVFRTRSYTYTRERPRMRGPTRLRTHTRTRASAVPPRTPARAASTTRRARPACGGAPPSRNGGAYFVQRDDTRGVPLADVRVERRRRPERLRAEPHTVDAGGRRSHVSARMRGRHIAHAHTRAHTDGRSTWVRVCGRPASAIRSSV